MEIRLVIIYKQAVEDDKCRLQNHVPSIVAVVVDDSCLLFEEKYSIRPTCKTLDM